MKIKKMLKNAGTVSDVDAIAMFEAMESIQQVQRFEIDEQTGLVNEYLITKSGYQVYISTYSRAWNFSEDFRNDETFAKLREELESDKSQLVFCLNLNDNLACLKFAQKNPFYKLSHSYTFGYKKLAVFKLQKLEIKVETKGDDYAAIWIDDDLSSEWKIDNINKTLTNTKCLNKLLIGRDEAILRLCFPNYN